MPQTDPGYFRQVGNAPCAAGLAQQGTQNLGGFGSEQRLERALFGGRLVRHRALDEHAAERDPGVAFQVEIADALLFAQLPYGR